MISGGNQTPEVVSKDKEGIMSHPILMSNNGQARYNQLLQEAEAERRYHKIKALNAKGESRFSFLNRRRDKEASRPAAKPALRAG
jgi:hypothetical protein